jgi:hypothetical protein
VGERQAFLYGLALGYFLLASYAFKDKAGPYFFCMCAGGVCLLAGTQA